MKILPAIDLYEGKAVRLFRGDYDQMTVYDENPVNTALKFKEAGARWIHVVDLEGARDGGTPNMGVIKEIIDATGLKVDACNTLLAILTALTIVLGMRMMGAMLISSLVIFPALTAMRLFKSFRGVILCAAVTSVVCFCVGLTISFGFSTPVGATVVAADLAVFLGACLLAALRRK